MAKPDLKPQEVLFSYVDALAKVNFMEAWSYQRTFQDAQRIEILKRIYLAILNRESSYPFVVILLTDKVLSTAASNRFTALVGPATANSRARLFARVRIATTTRNSRALSLGPSFAYYPSPDRRR